MSLRNFGSLILMILFISTYKMEENNKLMIIHYIVMSLLLLTIVEVSKERRGYRKSITVLFVCQS